MEEKRDLNGICCCCWTNYGSRSKSLHQVNETITIESMMKVFIFEGYSKNEFIYPSVVCSGCKRNLYRLNTGDNARGAWGEKVSKVEYNYIQ